MNYWKTSDIKITKDSVGYFDATHKYAGSLIETGFYEDRNECRRDAVKILMEKKMIENDEQ
tara:strand:- start:1145 stop:1327 length:183 start_codon:yes stop_codon:yes gene_type:complete